MRLMLDKLKLGASVLVAGTTDTAPNMNSFGKLLESDGVPHVYCADHEMHNTCKLAFGKNQENIFGHEHFNSCEKARAHIHFFNHSTQATGKLKATQANLLNHYPGKPLGVVSEVITRWWSTYSAMVRILHLRKAINFMHENEEMEKVERMNDDDWDRLKEISVVLKPSKDAQEQLEGEKYVSAGLVCPHENAIRTKLRNVADGRCDDEGAK